MAEFQVIKKWKYNDFLPNKIFTSVLNAPLAYKYGDWKYQLKNRNFEVEWPEEIELHKSVFKYYANTDYSIDALIKQLYIRLMSTCRDARYH